VHGHTKVECEQRPPLQRIRHVLDRTPKLDEPCLYIVDAPLCIQPALPPLQDASALILELPLVSCGGIELVARIPRVSSVCTAAKPFVNPSILRET